MHGALKGGFVVLGTSLESWELDQARQHQRQYTAILDPGHAGSRASASSACSARRSRRRQEGARAPRAALDGAEVCDPPGGGAQHRRGRWQRLTRGQGF